ncbi:glycoside hydrolase family 2 protein [Chitinophaga sp. CF418]|uniref:glycoside hydrolase family 2 protein n=1 Tax=Chitinophaga sp. CF418 TaxID=1855287 RepID=UPI0009196475|nr:sugar-binding domain-containing protein [Chitinophaga sp. CF418]SHM94424.1 Glycosyl hydrolases family 2, TIM barrel domain [Chitinophaga sp. CF418]
MNLSKTASVCFLSVVLGQGLMAQTNWQVQPTTIKTRWAKEVSPTNALPEYPRPQMVRENWQNLNGLWNYTITPKDAAMPSGYQEQILVPYPLESALSGVKKPLQPSENLWYKRAFTKPALKDGEHVLLHFGAVDWQATVYVNGKETGSHSGGYQAFSQDITAALKDGENEIVVKVFDPTSEGIGPHGKQVLNPANIYYTPTSGIWQTVWLETVPAAYISGLVMTPDIDKGILNVTVNAPAGTNVELIASDAGTEVSKTKGKAGAALKLPVKNAKLWSPSNPFLYDLTVKLTKGGQTVDQVKSYFGMRKIAIQKDEKGVDRIFLNNQAYFNLGTLDQGFWPDGLYTAPTDNALKFDIEAIKAMGFNTIRKHIKIEPARWYYHADKLGILVWQDFVNPNQGLPEGAKAEYEKETKETLEQLHNNPSITTWVIFNEKWGAYDQQRITEWVKATDPSRIVNGHSGEMLYVNEQLRSPSPNAWVSADMTDVHSYPDPMDAPAEPGKARVLGEFGGIGVFIPDHQWNTSSAWGYIQEKAAGLATKYTIMNQHLKLLEAAGLSGSIYTQPFDVEGEQNGLLTYDREVIKIPFDQMRKIHSQLNPDLGTIPQVTAKNADLTDPGEVYSKMLQDYINGRRDPEFLFKMSMMAQQAGDKNGANLAGGAYIATLQAPYTPEQLALILQFTSSTKDKGFSVLQEQLQSNNAKLEKRPVTVKLMNIVFKDVIDPVLQKSGDTPDWNAIANSIKPYGEPGEEIFLRAKTVYTFNKQDWSNYASAANTYLEKYGQNIPEQERNMFRQAINNSKNQ